MKSLGLFIFLILVGAVIAPPAHAGFRYTPASGSAAPATDAVVEGFADEVPLTVALRQVLPRGTVFSVADNVDITTKVSWQGGRPWREVLDTSLMHAGLKADYNNNMVRVEKAGMAGTSGAAPIRLQPPVVLTPPPSAHNPAPIVQGEVTSMDPNVSVNHYASSDSMMPTTVQPLGTTKPSAPLSGARVSGGDSAFVVTEDFNGQPKTANLVEITSMDPEIRAEVARGENGAPMPSNASSGMGYLTVPDHMNSTLMPMDAASAGPAVPHGASSEWHAKAGQMLRDVLLEWGARAGIEVNWQSEYDYPIQASMNANGTFEDAVRTLLYGFRDANPQPVGRLHKNEELGQQVLIINARGAASEE